jgi:hypothetical protein
MNYNRILLTNGTTALLVGTIVTGAVALAGGTGGCGSSSSNSPPTGDDGSALNDTGTGMDSASETSTLQDSAAEAATGSDGGSEGSATDGAAEGGGPSDAATDTSSQGEGGMPTDGGDAGCVTLNVYNFATWCSVSVNGGAFSAGASQTVCVAPGSIALEAQAKNAAFELGPDPWVYISGPGGTDSGTAGMLDGGVSSTTVVVGSNPGCVLVCCPFTNGTGCSSAFPGFSTWEANCP